MCSTTMARNSDVGADETGKRNFLVGPWDKARVALVLAFMLLASLLLLALSQSWIT